MIHTGNDNTVFPFWNDNNCMVIHISLTEWYQWLDFLVDMLSKQLKNGNNQDECNFYAEQAGQDI